MAASLGKSFRGTSGIEALDFRLKKLAVRVVYALSVPFFPSRKNKTICGWLQSFAVAAVFNLYIVKSCELHWL